MIRIENIKKRFKKLQVLDDVTVNFTQGQVIALIGPNASGKTTLIKSILGMVKPDSGKIYFNNAVINNDYAYRKDIGYMPQIGRYPENMKVGQLFKMVTAIREVDEKNVDSDLVDKFNLGSFYDKPMRIQYAKTKSDYVAKEDGTYIPKDKKKKQEENESRLARSPSGELCSICYADLMNTTFVPCKHRS